MGRLDDKIAIVTGSGSGIGAAAAALFHEEGARVVAVDLDEAAARATVESMGGEGSGVVVAGSVADPELWDRAIAAAEELGGLDLVHLNAGLYGWNGPIEELPLDLYERTVGANVTGVVLGVRASVPALRRRGGGAIVATASVAGIVPFALNSIYTLTKQAVTGFVTALAPNLTSDNITVDAVCPGIVDTPMTEGAFQGTDPRSLGFTLITPRTIAEAALDLATSPGTGRCRAVLPEREPYDWRLPDWQELVDRWD